jgi:hypothetical protein
MKIAGGVIGTGGSRITAFGFASAFSAFPSSERAIFFRDAVGNTYIAYKGGSVATTTLPIARNITTGDIITVRLDRVEGQADINIARFYINGQKQYETLNIPIVSVYGGIGVYGDASVTTARQFKTDYVSFKYVP